MAAKRLQPLTVVSPTVIDVDASSPIPPPFTRKLRTRTLTQQPNTRKRASETERPLAAAKKRRAEVSNASSSEVEVEVVEGIEKVGQGKKLPIPRRVAKRVKRSRVESPSDEESEGPSKKYRDDDSVEEISAPAPAPALTLTGPPPSPPLPITPVLPVPPLPARSAPAPAPPAPSLVAPPPQDARITEQNTGTDGRAATSRPSAPPLSPPPRHRPPPPPPPRRRPPSTAQSTENPNETVYAQGLQYGYQGPYQGNSRNFRQDPRYNMVESYPRNGVNYGWDDSRTVQTQAQGYPLRDRSPFPPQAYDAQQGGYSQYNNPYNAPSFPQGRMNDDRRHQPLPVPSFAQGIPNDNRHHPSRLDPSFTQGIPNDDRCHPSLPAPNENRRHPSLLDPSFAQGIPNDDRHHPSMYPTSLPQDPRMDERHHHADFAEAQLLSSMHPAPPGQG